MILTILATSALFLTAQPAWSAEPILLFPGYTTRVLCQGRLHLSSIGNDQLVHLEALPKELGCGVFLKPRQLSGRTNLVLETSSGTISRIVEVRSTGAKPDLRSLNYAIEGAAK